ncbi:unnamed protein product [Adineta ricciae]|uniref:Essential MCU regulator, mitochondrial n=1 Tax=Adineta ricciae TaxID=249248 RepID=A0A813SK21_ADIRI|nr:unnamed protein product [Adineta ricciae]
MSGLYPTEGKSNAPPPSYSQSTYSSPTVSMPLAGYPPTATITYGQIPIQCTCPYCRHVIVTRTETKTGVVPWIACLIIGCAGAFCGCCLIPFCIRSLKDTEHYCPSCQHYLGVGSVINQIKIFQLHRLYQGYNVDMNCFSRRWISSNQNQPISAKVSSIRSYLTTYIEQRRKQVQKHDIRLEPYLSKGVYTESGAIRPMPKRYPLGIAKVFLVAFPFLYLGSISEFFF